MISLNLGKVGVEVGLCSVMNSKLGLPFSVVLDWCGDGL